MSWRKTNSCKNSARAFSVFKMLDSITSVPGELDTPSRKGGGFFFLS